MISPYQAKYFAYELTRRCPPDSVEKLAGAFVDAQVDLKSASSRCGIVRLQFAAFKRGTPGRRSGH